MTTLDEHVTAKNKWSSTQCQYNSHDLVKHNYKNSQYTQHVLQQLYRATAMNIQDM